MTSAPPEPSVLDHHFLMRVFRAPDSCTREGAFHYVKAAHTYLTINEELAREVRNEEGLLRTAVQGRKVIVHLFGPIGSGKTTMMYMLRQSTNGFCAPELPDTVDIFPHLRDGSEKYLRFLKRARDGIPALLEGLYKESSRQVSAPAIQIRYLDTRKRIHDIFENCVEEGLCLTDGTPANDMFGYTPFFNTADAQGRKNIRDDDLPIIRKDFTETFGSTFGEQPTALILIDASPEVAYAGVRLRDREVERHDESGGVSLEYLRAVDPHIKAVPERVSEWGYKGPILKLQRHTSDELNVPHNPEHYLRVLRTVREGIEKGLAWKEHESTHQGLEARV